MIAHVITPHEGRTLTGKRRYMVTCSCGWHETTLRSRTPEAAIEYGTEIHASKKVPCPTPRKKRFKTEQTADAELGRFWQTAGKGKVMPCRVYECRCGGWHLTHVPLREQASA